MQRGEMEGENGGVAKMTLTRNHRSVCGAANGEKKIYCNEEVCESYRWRSVSIVEGDVDMKK